MRLFCKHVRVRCIHGDEIIGRGFRRRLCLDCGRALKGPLPEMCFYTGNPHTTAAVGVGSTPTDPHPGRADDRGQGGVGSDDDV